MVEDLFFIVSTAEVVAQSESLLTTVGPVILLATCSGREVNITKKKERREEGQLAEFCTERFGMGDVGEVRGLARESGVIGCNHRSGEDEGLASDERRIADVDCAR